MVLLISLALLATPRPTPELCIPQAKAAALRAALEAGCPVNAVNAFKETALILGAELGEADVTERLLAAGADLEMRSADGRTALFRAVAAGKLETVRALLVHKPKLEEIDASQRTATLLAAALPTPAVRLAMVKLLLDGGANLEALDGFSKGLLAAAISANDEALFSLVLARRPSLENQGPGALLEALNHSPPNWVKRLLEAGVSADVRFISPRGSAVIYAAALESAAGLAMLLPTARDLEVTDDEGRTALIVAALNGRLEAVKLLIAAGAKLTPKDRGGFTALARAENERQDAVASYLAQQMHVATLGAGVDVLIWGGGSSDAEASRWLASWESERGRYTELFQLAPGFPQVVKSDTVPGMNPGFHVVVLGYCQGDESRQRLGALKAIAERVYARRVKVEAKDGCPAMKATTERGPLVAVTTRAGNRIQVAEVNGAEGSTAWLTLRSKAGELLDQRRVGAASGPLPNGDGACESQLSASGESVRLQVSCAGSYRAGCQYPATWTQTAITEDEGKLALKKKSSDDGKPSKCFE